jgi:hypothetical protein
MGTALKEFRINFKNFAFLKNFRIKTLDPSPACPWWTTMVKMFGERILSSVHPLYHKDMFESEIDNPIGEDEEKGWRQHSAAAEAKQAGP